MYCRIDFSWIVFELYHMRYLTNLYEETSMMSITRLIICLRQPVICASNNNIENFSAQTTSSKIGYIFKIKNYTSKVL